MTTPVDDSSNCAPIASPPTRKLPDALVCIDEGRRLLTDVRRDLTGISHNVGTAEGFVRPPFDQERNEVAYLRLGEMPVGILDSADDLFRGSMRVQADQAILDFADLTQLIRIAVRAHGESVRRRPPR